MRMRTPASAIVAMSLGGLFAVGCGSTAPTGIPEATTSAATTGGSTGAASSGGTTASTTNGGTTGVSSSGGTTGAASTNGSTGAATTGGVSSTTGAGSTTASSGSSTGNATTTGGATGTTTTGGVSTTTGGATTSGNTGSSTGSSTTTGGPSGLPPGSMCSANSQCVSTVCGIAGSGNCCTAICDTTDAICGATGCDMSGACSYPSGDFCGTASCLGGMLTTSDCDGSGACIAGTPVACPNNFACADSTSCKTSCLATTDCASGFWCSASACVPLLVPGTACTENDACGSGMCGVSGSGNCCTAACATADPTCGATSCDSTGTCTYPAATTPCGTTSCSGSMLTTSACNGSGTCAVGTPTDCPNNLACNSAGTSCNASCTTATQITDCASGDFCDSPMSVCCGPLNGQSLSVDNATGTDAACCGYGSVGSCQTLTRAMSLVNGLNSLTPGTVATITATVNAGSGDWTNNETYPISLGWGVQLTAAGVYFTDTAGGATIFDIALQPGETTPANPVTLQGNGNLTPNAIVIGSDTLGNLTSDASAITVEANETLNVAFANVYEATGNAGISVLSSATLTLDQNASGGALNLGPFAGGVLPNGTAISPALGNGIACTGTISDSNSTAAHSVVGTGQAISIDAESGCALTLTDNPTFGWPTIGGYTGAGSGCTGNPTPMDGIGVLANGSATVSLSNASATCMIQYGIEANDSNATAALPSVTLSNVTIENCAQAGVYAAAGSVTVSSGTIDHNFIGVDQENDAILDTVGVTLNDGTMTNNTTVICNSNQETTGTGNPGIDVYNNSSGVMTADYVNWDNWYDPNGDATVSDSTDVFYCDATFTCQCEVFDSTATPACINTAGSNDMDLVLGGSTDSTPRGSQTSTNGAQAANACN